MRKAITFLVLVTLFATSLVACQSTTATPTAVKQEMTTAPTVQEATTAPATEAAPKTIKIGAFFNYSGASADAGEIDGSGAQFAVDWINTQGGVKSLGGANLELVKGDTLSDSSQAKSVVERILSENPDLVASVGAGGSDFVLAMGSTLEKAQIPMTHNGVSSKIGEQHYKYIFEPVPTAFGQTQIEFIQQMLNKQLGMNITKVGIIYEDTSYGLSVAQGDLKLAESAGLQVAFNQSFPQYSSDVSALVTNLKSSGAQVVLPVAFTQDAKLIFDTMASMNYNPIILGGGAGFLYPSFGDALGDAVNGVFSVASLTGDEAMFQKNSQFKDLASEYEKKYGYFMSERGAGSFDSVYLIWQALEKCGCTDGPTLASTIRGLKIPTLQPSSAADGSVAFDEDGRNVNAIPIIIQWQKWDDGKYRPRTVYPESMVVGGTKVQLETSGK